MKLWIVPAAARELGPLRALAEVAHEVRSLDAPGDVTTALRESAPDLIVCALADPEAGLDLLRDVRAAGCTSRFVLLADRRAADLRERAKLLGGADWLELDRLTEDALLKRYAKSIPPKPQPARPAPTPPVANVAAPAGVASAGSRANADAVPDAALPDPAPPDPAPPGGVANAARNADFAPAMLWRTDASGDFTHFTLEWCRFRGRSEEDEKGAGWEAGLHPDDRVRWRETFRKALGAGEGFELDLRLQRADRSYRWMRHRGKPRFRDGRLSGFLGSTFDIHDLRGEVSGLREQVERLIRKEREAAEFAHAVGHELEEPLRTVEHALRVIVEDLDPDDEVDQRVAWLQHARESAARMRRLLRDLLRLALAGEGGSRESVNLDDPLDWALANLNAQLERSAAVVLRRPLPAAWCEPTQIAQVFQNLIGNAIKFRGRDPLEIEVGGQREGEFVVVYVRDNGLGIAPSDHEVIFEAFQRRAGDEASGVGLGLALCRRIVERHGGTIGVRSAADAGALFRFWLPAGAEQRTGPQSSADVRADQV